MDITAVLRSVYRHCINSSLVFIHLPVAYIDVNNCVSLWPCMSKRASDPVEAATCRIKYAVILAMQNRTLS